MTKKNIAVDACILFRPLLLDIDEFMTAVAHLVEELPEYKPNKWNIVEPINKDFDLAAIREGMLLDNFFNFNWRRTIQPKGWGKFGCAAPRLKRHAKHSLYVSANSSDHVDRILQYVKASVADFGADYAYIDSLAAPYKDYGVLCGAAPYRTAFMIFSAQIRKNLPDILWSQVFGPPYVRLFGLKKLLSAPAYKVEQLGAETVHVQLSESLFDMHERYEEVDAVRQKVKAHLDDNIFFKSENPEGHVYRTPDFQFPPKPETPIV